MALKCRICRRFAKPPKYPKNLHRPVSENRSELDDIFAWQTLRTLSKSSTFQYDKMLYLVESSGENAHIAGERVLDFDYPDGTLAFRYGNRTLKYQVFDKLACIDQGRIVDNKRLGVVLRLALEKQGEQGAEGQRSRSKKMPRRLAQERALEELWAINPVLISPEYFVPSLKR